MPRIKIFEHCKSFYQYSKRIDLKCYVILIKFETRTWWKTITLGYISQSKFDYEKQILQNIIIS
jgi:hypothetical protein